MRRTSSLAVIAVFLASGLTGAAVAGCGATQAVTVVRVSEDERIPEVSGDPVKVRRGGLEGYTGLRGGYFVVRNAEDWHNAWAGSSDAGPEPRMPGTFNTNRTMLLVGVGDRKNVVELSIEKVVETGDRVHVWARETLAGEGCQANAEQEPFDAVLAPRIDKPVKFYVHAEPAGTCGKGPAVSVKCRVNSGAAWLPTVSASPGDTVECETTADLRGKFAVIDKGIAIAELPPGSSAKLAFTQGAARGSFKADVFGRYKVRGEATDESNRKGSEVATIDCMPPKTRDVVAQLVWTNFDASDDPSTFPRVQLRATDGTKAPPCAVDSPRPSLCEAKTVGASTQMTLKVPDKKVPLEVRYADERAEKGPAVCVQLFFDGAKTGEACDLKRRDADEVWRLGTVDTAVGKLVDGAGAADAGASGDAGGASASGDAGSDAAAGSPKPVTTPKKK